MGSGALRSANTVGSADAVRQSAVAAMTADELRSLLERALGELDADERSGPLFSASGLRVRFEVSDLRLRVDVAADQDRSGHHLRWSFGEAVDWEPKLSLAMDSDTANAYLQGRESIAIAIARGQVRCDGESRVALLYLPLLRLLVDPYRRAVRELAPALAV